ncbi:MAG: dockerin type I repeat-containing protein [Spirochaetales bacterium]|nr:dockerin type I repeat-containing protein [Spirochaetales bacterium]
MNRAQNRRSKERIITLCIFLFLSIPVFSASLGDVDSNSSIDIVDALLVAQHYVGLNPGQFDSSAADVDANSSIDIVDALLIAQYYVGLIDRFPGETATPLPTPSPTTVPGGNEVDAFGITNLYPDIPGVQEWNSLHWNNGIERTLSGSAGTRDPYDPTGWSQYRGNGFLTFTGSGLLLMGGGGEPRIYINPYEGSTETNPEVFWKNVEVSVYYMRIGTDGANWGGCIIGARSGPNGHTGTNPCTATTYYARLRHDGKIDFEKELMHSPSTVGISQTYWGGNPLPSDRWIGMKYCIYNIDNNQHVKLEMYLDTTSNGANGGTWEKVLEFTDDGNWAAPADGCSFPDTYIVTEGGGVVFIRNTNIAEARYKWFTVREIQAGN